MQLYVPAGHGRREVGQLTAGPAHRGMNDSRKKEKERTKQHICLFVCLLFACLAFISFL
jgi:hypothetical protein